MQGGWWCLKETPQMLSDQLHKWPAGAKPWQKVPRGELREKPPLQHKTKRYTEALRSLWTSGLSLPKWSRRCSVNESSLSSFQADQLPHNSGSDTHLAGPPCGEYDHTWEMRIWKQELVACQRAMTNQRFQGGKRPPHAFPLNQQKY